MTVNVAVFLLPFLSAAVHVTVVAPIANIVPLFGSQLNVPLIGTRG